MKTEWEWDCGRFRAAEAGAARDAMIHGVEGHGWLSFSPLDLADHQSAERSRKCLIDGCRQ